MRCLVIVLAQTRAHHLTFDRFKTHMLDAVNPGGETTDLALCVSDGEDPTNNPFYKHAKHVFRFREQADFAASFDEAAQTYGWTNHEWRELLKAKDQWLGGIKDPHHQHPGSAGILIYCRWHMLRELMAAGLEDAYDWFVVTRSDYYYLGDHPNVQHLSPDHIYVPTGEDYNGITDRHTIVPAKHLRPAMDLMSYLMTDPRAVAQEMRESHKYNGRWNLESVIWHVWGARGLQNKVLRFPLVMFTVRDSSVGTRWQEGRYHDKYNLIVKYRGELQAAETNTSK